MIKKHRHIIYFLITIIVIQFIFRRFGVSESAAEDGIKILILTPLIYAIYHLILSLYKLIKKEYLNSFYSFLKFLLFLLILLKLEYEHYNFLITLIIILLIAFFLYKRDLQNYFYTIFDLLLINFILLLTPDTSILKYFEPGRESWHQISLSEFNMPPQKDATHSAIIDLEFRYKINRVYNYPPVIFLSLMNPDKSWVKPEYLNNISTLEHEQFHFDILEFHKKLIIDSIEKCWACSYETKESILNSYISEEVKMQNDFDTAYAYHDTMTLKNLKNLIK